MTAETGVATELRHAAIRLVGLRKEFGSVVAVDGIDLEVAEGEFFSMLGPSGSGKTTVLRMVAGFEQPTAGQVLLGGEDVTREPPFTRDVNTVFQDYALFPHMDVRQNVEYGLRVKKVAKAERRRRAEEALETVRLTGFGDRRPQQLAESLGPTMGPWYRRLGRGVDSSPVDPTPWVPRAHGREETFQTDLADWAEVAAAARRLAAQVAEDVRAEGRPAVRVGVKVRYTPFETRQRSLTLPGPTDDGSVIADAAVELVARLDHTRKVRLLGVRAEMAPPGAASSG